MIWILGIILTLLVSVNAKTNVQYPLNSDSEPISKVVEFGKNDPIPLGCIARQIDNGEHKFDSKGNIIYEPFPVCRETGESLSFKYGLDEDVTCSIKLSDELYHLFQLYIHQDAPYTCRLPASKNLDVNQASIPMNLNFRGYVSESHIDIDPNLNILISKPSSDLISDSNNLIPSIISSVGWASSTNTTRVVIGDTLKLSFSVRWYEYALNNEDIVDTELYDLGLSKTLAKGYGNTGFFKFPLPWIINGYSQSRVVGISISSLLIGFLLGLFVIRQRMIKFTNTKSTFGGELGKSD